MTNAELISMVRSIAKHGADWRINEVLNRAAAALEAAEKKIAGLERQLLKEGEWITADNPPKNEGLYLVGLSVGWDNEYVVRLARYTKDLSEALFSSKLSGDGWYRWDGDNDCDVICHPKYWMELPEPPNCGARMDGERKDNETKLKGE